MKLGQETAPGTPSGSRVEIYDTSLRDGSQGEGVTYTVLDKLRIYKRLSAFGLAYVEGGWPGSNPKDAEFFERARELELGDTQLAAFGSTRRAGKAPEDDPNLKALLASGAPVNTIFGKTWTLHVTEVLRTELATNLLMIEESVRYLCSHGRKVFFDAEHFFDGYRADSEYAIETLLAAERGGAEALVLCDTNGGSLPWQVEDIVRKVAARVRTTIGVHAHDDTGCAVANSLAAVVAGARQVQGTINGIGERCGNANLSVIIPNLELKLGMSCLPTGKLEDLSEVSRFVADVANLTPSSSMAYVGRSAFAHKGGVHVSAMRRHADSYQHVDPALIGNQMRVVISDLSGRSNVSSKAEELGLEVDAETESSTLEQIKEAEARGISYEGAEASASLLLLRKQAGYEAPFQLLDYQTMVGSRRGFEYIEATVRLKVGGETMHTVGDGTGPVGALDSALRKALLPHFPVLSTVHLADYKVRILDGHAGTSAVTRVLIDSQDEFGSFSTVGASPNIIEASMAALTDALEYAVLRPRRAHPSQPAPKP